jgi:hypothetical protein
LKSRWSEGKHGNRENLYLKDNKISKKKH